MKPEDIDQLLESGRYKHLSEETLVSYRDNQLDKIRGALADAHLRLCLICEQKLAFLKEEAEVVANYVITEEDRAAIQQTVRELKDSNGPGLISTEVQRLSSYLNDLLTAWIIPFGQPAMRGAGDGDEVWRYESKDGLLTAWAILESNASLTVHFSSPNLAWEGVRLRFRLGPFSKEVALQREGDSRVAARIVIPRRERAKKMNDISLEVV